VANAALGGGHGAQKGRVVVVVGPQAKPGTQVADFGAVKKTLATRYLVRNTGAAQGFLKRLGLVVGTVQHRKMAEFFELRAGLHQCPLGPQALYAGHGALGFVFFVVGVHHPHRLAFTQVAPQVFGEQLGVGANHIVGGAQDGTGRAVVLLQFDDLERGKSMGSFFRLSSVAPRQP
jgi:hypothetical protein